MLSWIVLGAIASLLVAPLSVYLAGRVAKLQKVNKLGVMKPMGFWWSFGTVFVASIIASLLSFNIQWLMVLLFMIAVYPGIQPFKPTGKQIGIFYGIVILFGVVLSGIYYGVINFLVK